AQTAHLGGEAVRFAAGESICTEHSHKYTLAGFASLAGQAGFRVESVWTDPDRLFSVQWLAATSSGGDGDR
ncbi:MAG: L-histidine N(alpha)-methyltransferase, partial [Myxococcota bacterium]|nr:L-histidine N(alpha)-methyltransferase [Myxococcota bacterium]